MAEPTRLRIHIRLFAMQRELAGTRAVDVEVAPGSTIEDAWTALVADPRNAAVTPAC